MPVLDTNFLIALAHGDATAQAALEVARADGALLVPAQAALEFLSGAADPVAQLQAIRDSFELVHTSDAHVLEGAALRAKARASGIAKPHWGDIHIAAVALLGGTYVVTANKRDFTTLGVPAWHFGREGAPPG